MALIPSQVLRVAILLSYFSILCHYKALDMPAHQTYGGSWKFLTFIDLVSFHCSRFIRAKQPAHMHAASCTSGSNGHPAFPGPCHRLHLTLRGETGRKTSRV